MFHGNQKHDYWLLFGLNKKHLFFWVSSAIKEWDAHCRQLIFDHHVWCREATGDKFPFPCVFDNVEGCIPLNTYDPNSDFVGKLKAVSRSKLVRFQHCYTHGKMCDLFNPSLAPDLETAGLPCWDFSLAGARRCENGPTCTVFMAHAKRHKELRTPLLIIENVQEWIFVKCSRAK